MQQEFIQSRFSFAIDGTVLDVSAIHRAGEEAKAPIVFLHGFGSTKEDYADIVRHDAFAGSGIRWVDSPH